MLFTQHIHLSSHYAERQDSRDLILASTITTDSRAVSRSHIFNPRNGPFESVSNVRVCRGTPYFVQLEVTFPNMNMVGVWVIIEIKELPDVEIELVEVFGIHEHGCVAGSWEFVRRLMLMPFELNQIAAVH